MSDIKTGTIQTTGFADLEKMLLGLPDKLAKNVMFGAMRAGAVVIQKAAKDACPVSAEAHFLGKKGTKGRELIQPGTLKKKGIRVRRLKRSQGATSVAVAAYVSNRYWYANFVEYGHRIGSRWGSGVERAYYSERVLTKRGYWQTKKKVQVVNDSRGHVPAKPFMRPAWDNNKEQALEAVRAYLAERIPKELANVR